MEFRVHRWSCLKISHICVKMFGSGFDIFRYYFDFVRWWNQAGFLWMFVDTNYWGHG